MDGSVLAIVFRDEERQVERLAPVEAGVAGGLVAVVQVALAAGPARHVESADDPYAPMRRFLFDLLRRAGEANSFRVQVDAAGLHR